MQLNEGAHVCKALTSLLLRVNKYKRNVCPGHPLPRTAPRSSPGRPVLMSRGHKLIPFRGAGQGRGVRTRRPGRAPHATACEQSSASLFWSLLHTGTLPWDGCRSHCLGSDTHAPTSGAGPLSLLVLQGLQRSWALIRVTAVVLNVPRLHAHPPGHGGRGQKECTLSPARHEGGALVPGEQPRKPSQRLQQKGCRGGPGPGGGCVRTAASWVLSVGAQVPPPPTEKPRPVSAPPWTPSRACAQPAAGGGRLGPTWQVTSDFLCL